MDKTPGAHGVRQIIWGDLKKDWHGEIHTYADKRQTDTQSRRVPVGHVGSGSAEAGSPASEPTAVMPVGVGLAPTPVPDLIVRTGSGFLASLFRQVCVPGRRLLPIQVGCCDWLPCLFFVVAVEFACHDGSLPEVTISWTSDGRE